MPLPTDKELIKEFIGTKNYMADDAIRLILNDYEDFKKSKEASVSKEYEIIDWKYKKDGALVTDFFYNHNVANVDRHLFTINSVNRTSDNICFKVGDKVFDKNYPTNTYSIEKFDTVGGFLRACFNEGGFMKVSKLSHSKVPLLICNWDGVEIFDGDKFFTVDINYCVHEFKADHSISKIFSEINKTFSTEQAAKEYINLNKPMYSLNQIKQAFSVCGLFGCEGLIRWLQELNQ